ncbi:MAG TPA: TonB-dependent receptor plug domain-containing protein, partial [Sphingobium sp.]|nr:TonB-dependent receptor plug domain-containing protein [Sphingobium sp.]
MIDHRKAVLAAILSGCSLLPSVGLAQGGNASDPATSQIGLQDIIVTAQKKEESLQMVPVAVTALDKGKLENLQVQNFNDLAGLAPNLTAVNSGSGSNPIVTLRGIVGGNVEPGRDNGVAMYLDGVYIPRTTGAQFDVADLERVEILRGPQGTLYGRNSTGGAINYITAAPKGKLYARQEVTVGNLGLLRTKTRIDLPKFGAFSVSGTFLHEERNGYVRNVEAGRVWDFSQLPGGFLNGTRRSVKRLGDRNAESLLASVRYAPESIPLTVDYKFDWTDAQYSNLPKQVLLDLATGFPRTIPATTTRLDAIAMGFTTPEHLKVFGHNLTITLDLSDEVQFKSITGYRGFTDQYSADVAGGGFENYSPAPGRSYHEVLGIVAHERDRSFSQEVQLSYRSDIIDAIAGLYYFKQHTRTLNPLFARQFLSPPNLPNPANVTDAD